MVKARSVAARFTTEVAPPLAVSTTMRRRAAPVRRLEPIPEDDREQLAYWSEYHQHLQQADAATTENSSGFAAAWSKTKRAPPPAQASTGGGPTRDLCRASSRKGHRRVV